MDKSSSIKEGGRGTSTPPPSFIVSFHIDLTKSKVGETMITNQELQNLIKALKPYEVHTCGKSHDFKVNGYHIYIFEGGNEEYSGIIHVHEWSE